MKKLELSKKIYLCTMLFLGMGSALFGAEKLLYGDNVHIKNIGIKKYATRDGNVLVGHKVPSDRSVFTIIKDVGKPELNKGESVKYGEKFYLQTSPAAVVGDSGEVYRIYGMKRKLLGAVPTVLNKIYEFTILPSTGKKDGQPVYYGEKINLQYKIPTSKSPIKYFRFNVSLSTYKKGTEVFGSDNSKLMTKAQIKETKELAFEKAQGVPAAKPTKPEEKKITYYDILGVDKNADRATIARICRDLSLKIHPDKVKKEEKSIANEAMQVINETKDILTSSEKSIDHSKTKREVYDEWLQGGSNTAWVHKTTKQDRDPNDSTKFIEKEVDETIYINRLRITPGVFEYIKEKLGIKSKDSAGGKTWVKGKVPAKERASGPKIGSRESAVDCPICLETLVEGDEVAALSCDPKHIFHKNCIEDWLKRDKTCPICRKNVQIAKIYKLK